MKVSLTSAALAVLLALPGSAPAAGEPWRPGYHFTPEKNWMNDPNGMVWHDGEWHLFYQYNPFGDTWGHMSWGHAVSTDLLHWEHLPVALPEENGIMIFSGSAVVDHANTSGFGKDGKPPMVAIYTAHTSTNQSQALAFSNDRGRTWTKYSGNPVLDIGAKDFRDPKVMWHEPSRAWIMTIAWPNERKIRFYRSPDLKQWTHLSDFGPAGSTSGIWECPDLVPLPAPDGKTVWLLIVNVGSGAPAGGSGGQYFLGSFDGTRFTPDPASNPQPQSPQEPQGTVLADFENGYGAWTATGEGWGSNPATGPLNGQHPTPGFKGKSFVNSYLGGDGPQGTLTSPEFSLDAPWLSFLIGGGRQPGKTCVNLKVDGKIVQTATGADNELLQWHAWNVTEWIGQKGQIEIVDAASGGWGHINADHFVLGDQPGRSATHPSLWLDFGPDFYAAVTWSGGPPGDNRRLLLGWMSGWPYANQVPTSPWRSAMSLPRELTVATLPSGSGGHRLIQQPIRELAGIQGAPKIFQGSETAQRGGNAEAANAWLDQQKISGDKLDIELAWSAPPDGPAGLTLFAGDEEETGVQFTVDLGGRMKLDRSRSGKVDFSPEFPRSFQAPSRVAPMFPPDLVDTGFPTGSTDPPASSEKRPWRILVDSCSVEIFAPGGFSTLTALAFPPAGACKLRFAPGTMVHSLKIHSLEPRKSP